MVTTKKNNDKKKISIKLGPQRRHLPHRIQSRSNCHHVINNPPTSSCHTRRAESGSLLDISAPSIPRHQTSFRSPFASTSSEPILTIEVAKTNARNGDNYDNIRRSKVVTYGGQISMVIAHCHTTRGHFAPL